MNPPPTASTVLRRAHLETGLARVPRPRPVAAAQPQVAETVAAQAQVDAAMEQARRQAMHEGREEGLRRGHEEGLAEGRKAAEVQVRAALARAVGEGEARLQEKGRELAALAAALVQARGDAWAAAEEDMVALCFETICRVLGAGAPSADALRAQLKQLAPLRSHQEPLAVHVHPDDFHLLTAAGAGAGEDPAGIRWRADAEVALGGCIVRTESGTLDARLETILANMKRALMEARGRTQVAPEGVA
jgi:flagellar assembly protein FliH